MKPQLALPLEIPTIEHVAAAFEESTIYYMAECEFLPEYVADNAIKQRRRSANGN